MNIHIIGTVNGIENEGMRNIATHLSKEFEKEHRVCHSGLKQLPRIIHNCCRSDVTFIVARANKRVYWLARLVERLCPGLYMVCVQRPEAKFLRLNAKHPLRCGWLAIDREDLSDIDSDRKHWFPVGINGEKFAPVDADTAAKLKKKYGFSPEKPLVLHVGHCSVGRGLEDFLALDGQAVQRLVVASGMFEDGETVRRLEQGGVTLHRGFLPQVEEVYQMADCYLFPTRSTEFVISVPLSVMEALSCGTPVISYRSFGGLKGIQSVKGAVSRINTAADLNAIVPKAAAGKQNRSLLAQPHSWSEAAAYVMNIVKEECR